MSGVTDQPLDAPQLRRELASLINAGGLLRAGKFKQENSTRNVRFMSFACSACEPVAFVNHRSLA